MTPFSTTLALCGLVGLLLAGRAAPAQPPTKSVYPPAASSDLSTLQAQCAPLLAESENRLLGLVPPQAGFWFGDCPHCDQGSQEHQLVWEPKLGEQVQCQHCRQWFPSAQYPENGQITLPTPSGGTQVWKYHQAKNGSRFWFEARRWHEQRKHLDQGAYRLAQLWALTNNKEAGRRAARLLIRFAQAYPDYIVHYDYPHRPKQFFTNGVPADFEPFRAAKWAWWAYTDVSVPLLKTYDLLAPGAFFSPTERARIENDLFRAMLAFVARYDGARLTNMHPTLWNAQAIAARVLRDDALAGKVLAQMRRLVDEQFFFDGFWKEGTASYHQHTVGGLQTVLGALYPELDKNALAARLRADHPDLARALQAADALRLPDGRFAPLRDTGPDERSAAGPLAASRPQLLPGLGYALLGMGQGQNQLQAHLNFTGRFGHNHYDSLGLLLFGVGRELFSDLGYTHSRARPWTMTTASHNTVVIDQRCQTGGDALDGGRGRLLIFNASDPAFQMAAAEAPGAYPGLATTYRRSLLVVESGGARYVVDVFDVAGGKQHDWILHGSADEAQTLEITDARGQALPQSAQPSLLPAGVEFVEPRNEGDAHLATRASWAYGLFRDVRSSGPADAADVVATFRGADDPRAGVRSWIIGAPQTRVITATAWAVRGIGPGRQADAAKLDQLQRQALLVGREGPQSRFVAVHCPFAANNVAVAGVRAHALEPGGVALEITRTNGGVDFVLLGGGANKTRKWEFDGHAALITTDKGKRVVKMIGGTRLSWGDQTLTAPPAPPARLLRVRGQELVLAGTAAATLLAPGSVVIVRHGDGTTTPFHVAVTRQENGTSVIRTREPAALIDAAEGALTRKQFPRTEAPGPHEVFFTTVREK